MPVICLEPALFDDFRMAGTVQNTDFGQTAAKPSSSSRLSLTRWPGLTVPISSTAGAFSWARPAQGAISIGRIVGSSNQMGIFAFEAGSGAHLRSGPRAASRLGGIGQFANDAHEAGLAIVRRRGELEHVRLQQNADRHCLLRQELRHGFGWLRRSLHVRNLRLALDLRRLRLSQRLRLQQNANCHCLLRQELRHVAPESGRARARLGRATSPALPRREPLRGASCAAGARAPPPELAPELAPRVGYENDAALSRAFWRIVGASPGLGAARFASRRQTRLRSVARGPRFEHFASAVSSALESSSRRSSRPERELHGRKFPEQAPSPRRRAGALLDNIGKSKCRVSSTPLRAGRKGRIVGSRARDRPTEDHAAPALRPGSCIGATRDLSPVELYFWHSCAQRTQRAGGARAPAGDRALGCSA